MTKKTGKVERPEGEASILHLVYDGECALCSSLVHWVKARDRRGVIIPIPYQNRPALERLGITREDAERQVITVEPGNAKRGGAAAINRVLEVLGGPWALFAKVRVVPLGGPLENWLYKWVSRHRRRIGVRKIGLGLGPR